MDTLSSDTTPARPTAPGSWYPTLALAARAEAALASFPRRALVDRYPHTLGILVGLAVGGASAARMAGWL